MSLPVSKVGWVEWSQVLNGYYFIFIASSYGLALIILIILSTICLRKLLQDERHKVKSASLKTNSLSQSLSLNASSWWRVMTYSILLSILLFLGSLSWTSRNNCGSSLYPDLLEAGVEELVAGLETGTWKSVELTKAYILRIQETNDILHAITEINPDALTIAAALDLERANGKIRSPLHGIPILIKDNIATKDAMNNSAGSFALLGATVRRDSTIASKLRAAGVILLGKSNLSQWANYRSSNSSSGWSAYGGQVSGAYYPNMTPSGSSSGSGVAASIGLALAAIGTETDGSITSPSSYNNIVGIKPSVGLTSRSLVIPISEHQDTIGPMARSVTDAAYILSIMAGKDPEDNYTFAQPFVSPPDYIRALNFSSLRGARIGVPRNGFMFNETSGAILDEFESAIKVIKRAGATVIENTNFSAWDQYIADQTSTGVSNYSIVINGDFISNLAGYFSQLVYNPNNIHNLEDAANFTRNHPLEEFPDRNTLLWDKTLALGYNNTDSRFWDAYQYTSYWGGEGGVLGALKAYDLDALIMPTDFSFRLPAFAGLPVLTLPMGFYPKNTPVVKNSRGLVQIGPNIPFGLSFLGPKWSEETLIGFAFAYEQRTKTRTKVKPHITPKTQLADVVGS